MILSTLDKSRKGGAYEQIPSLVLGQRWTPQLNSRNMMKVVLCVWIEPYIENDLSFCVWPVHTPTTSKEVLTLSASTSPLPYTGNKSCIVNTILSVMPKHTVYIDPCMGSAAENLVNREFESHGPRAILLTDITYIPLCGRFCYLVWYWARDGPHN